MIVAGAPFHCQAARKRVAHLGSTWAASWASAQVRPPSTDTSTPRIRPAPLQARPLIIHGLADTNVHLQNSVNLIEAMMAIDKPFDFLPLPNSDHHYGGDGLVGVLSESAKYFVEHLGHR